jgi:hypothetical protein
MCTAALEDDLSTAEAEAHRETARVQSAADVEIEGLHSGMRALKTAAALPQDFASPVPSRYAGATEK